MASYIVLEPAGNRPDKGERALVIRDGFSFLALIMPLFWFLWHRMWLEALAFLCIGLLLAGLGTMSGFSITAPLLSFILYLFIGLEAQGLRIASLRRRGWEVWGVVEGANRDEAELRYSAEIAQAPVQRPSAAALPVAVSRAAPASQRPSPTFGLVEYPRKG